MDRGAAYLFVATSQPPTDIAVSNSLVPLNQPSGTAVGGLSTTDPDPATRSRMLW